VARFGAVVMTLIKLVRLGRSVEVRPSTPWYWLAINLCFSYLIDNGVWLDQFKASSFFGGSFWTAILVKLVHPLKEPRATLYGLRRVQPAPENERRTTSLP